MTDGRRRGKANSKPASAFAEQPGSIPFALLRWVSSANSKHAGFAGAAFQPSDNFIVDGNDPAKHLAVVGGCIARVKRTSAVALHMSANDPKPTCRLTYPAPSSKLV
jgi:hypothetical protein